MIKKLVKDIVIYGGSDFIFKFINFAVFPIYANILNVSDFGVMSLVITYSSLIGIVANVGLNNAVQRFYWDKVIPENKRPSLVSTGLYVQTFWSIILIAIVLLLTYFFGQSYLEKTQIPWAYVLLCLIASVFDRIIFFGIDTIRLQLEPLKYTLLSSVKNIFSAFLCILFTIVLHKGLTGYFQGLLISYILTTPLALFLVKKNLTIKFDFGYAKDLLKFGYPFIFAGLAYWLFSSMDRWMLSTMSNNVQVGLYDISFKFAMVISFVSAAFGMAWSPMVIKIVNEDPDYRATIGRIFTYFFLIVGMLGILISMFGYELLLLTTKKDYHEARHIMPFVSMGIVFYCTTQITALGISLEKKTNYLSYFAWFTAIINFGLNYLFIPKFGAVGSAFATLISYIVLTGGYYLVMRRIHPIKTEYKKMLSILLSILLSLLFLYFLNKQEWSFYVIIYKVIFLTLVVIAFFITNVINIQQLKELWGKFSKRSL